MKSNFNKTLQNEESAKRNLQIMKTIDIFSKLALPDLTISLQNMHKGLGCQASNNMTLKLSSDFNLSKRWRLVIAHLTYLRKILGKILK